MRGTSRAFGPESQLKRTDGLRPANSRSSTPATCARPCGAIASRATCSATMPAITATCPLTLPPVPRSSSPISSPWLIPADCTTSRPISLSPPLIRRFGGYNFTRWKLRLSYTGNAILPRPVDQTFEILYDNFQNGDTTTAFSNSGFHILRVTAADTTTELDNPTAAANNGFCVMAKFSGSAADERAPNLFSTAAGSTPSTGPAWGQRPPMVTIVTTAACFPAMRV